MEQQIIKGYFQREDYYFKLLYFTDEKEYKAYMLQLILQGEIINIKLRGISSTYVPRLWKKHLKLYRINIDSDRWFILERISDKV